MCTLQVEVREPLTFESQFFPFPTWDCNEPSYWLKIGVIKKKYTEHKRNQESRLFRDSISINRPCCDTVPSHHPVGKCLTPPLTMQCHRTCAKSIPLPPAQFSCSQWVNPSCNAQRSKSRTVTPNPKLQLLSWTVIPSSGLQQCIEHRECGWAYTPETKVNFGNAVMGPSLSHSFTFLWDYSRA